MKMFDFEWTGQSFGNETDRQRGISAALTYCADKEIDAAGAYEAALSDDPEQAAIDLWAGIELAAVSAMSDGWHNMPDNVSLIWRQQ
jgi:hypothetical protein